MKYIQIKDVSKKDHSDFKAKCATSNTDMTKALRAYIKAVLSGEAKIYH